MVLCFLLLEFRQQINLEFLNFLLIIYMKFSLLFYIFVLTLSNKGAYLTFKSIVHMAFTLF